MIVGTWYGKDPEKPREIILPKGAQIFFGRLECGAVVICGIADENIKGVEVRNFLALRLGAKVDISSERMKYINSVAGGIGGDTYHIFEILP